MFSIACSIGTDLVIGSVVFSVMTALGEMAAFLTMNKSFGGYATRMVDQALEEANTNKLPIITS